MDAVTFITKLQKFIRDSYQNIGGAMISGTVDSMEKYKYMSEGQRRSAVQRKRAAGNTGPKPTFVKTFTKKYYGGMINVGD